MPSVNDLECRYTGNSVTVKLTNSSSKPETLEFECVYDLSNGTTHTTSGTTTLFAGQVYETNSEATAADVTGVASKSVIEA